MRALTSLTTRSAIMRSRSDSSRPAEGLGRVADRHARRARRCCGRRSVTAERAAASSRAPPQRRAGHLPHVALDLLALAVALGVGVAALEVRDDALVVGGVGAHAAVAVLVADLDALPTPVPYRSELLLLLGELRHGAVEVDAVLLAHRLEQPAGSTGCGRRPTGRWRPRRARGRGWGRPARGRPRSGCRGRRSARRRRRAS